jgi:hypothetical protein
MSVEEIAKQILEETGSAEEARWFVAELVKFDFAAGTGNPAYSSMSLTSEVAALKKRVAALEAQISRTGEAPKTDSILSNTGKKRNLPKGLPEGSVAARDFYLEKGISPTELRYHTERGIYGDFLETTDIPHKTRPGFKYRYLTPDQQRKAVEYWKEHGVNYLAE